MLGVKYTTVIEVKIISVGENYVRFKLPDGSPGALSNKNFFRGANVDEKWKMYCDGSVVVETQIAS